MNEEILKEFEILKKIIRLAIDSNNGQPVMEYLHEILKCDFIFYNYVQNNRIVIGTEENVPDSDCFEYEIGFKNELLGKILINTAKENITDFMKKVLSYVADAFVLINKEKFSVERVEKDLKQELVLDICTGNIKSREELSIRSKLNGWEIKDNLVVVIFDVDEYKKKTVDLKESSREIEVVKEKMFRDLKNNFLDAGMTFYNYQNSDSIIFLFEFDNNYLQSKDKLFKKMMKESIEEYGFTYTVGIGRIVNNIFDAPISYTEAREAVKIGRSMLGLGMIHEYKDLELFPCLIMP